MATKYKKRADGRYAKQITIGYSPEGKQIKKTVYGKTIKELEKNYRDFIELREKGIIISDNRMTFAELAELWITNTKVGAVRDQTITNIRSQVCCLNKHIGHLKVKDITVATLEAYRAAQIEAGKIDQYNKSITMMRSIFDYGIEKDVIVRNAAASLKRISYSGLKTKRRMADLERTYIDCSTLTDQERCLLYMLLYTGMRKSELLALSRNDIDFRKGVITVSKTLVSSKKKEDVLQELPKTDAGLRMIPISAQLMPVLKAYTSSKLGILFEAQQGGYYSSSGFFKYWKAICKKIATETGEPVAEDFTPHLFRHTYASDLYRAGVDVKSAQYLVGHSDIKTTLDTYTHFEGEDVSISKLEEYYSKSQSKINISQISVS